MRLLILAILAGCADHPKAVFVYGDSDTDAVSDAEGDTDADTDSEGDTDADTDADTGTDEPLFQCPENDTAFACISESNLTWCQLVGAYN